MSLTTQKFDILSRIAVGNGALVYRALDKETMRQVALKLLMQDGDWEHRLDVDYLMQEAPRLRQIAGAHVCQLLDAYNDEDGPVLIYEFANGQNGVDLPVERKLDPTQALDVAAQLISALRSGERQRCPHGDVKPSNIVFVDLPDGRPFLLVLDWGLGVFRSGLPEDSLAFFAPERLGGESPSHRADLFSAGATLFYLFTGKPLVGGATPEELRAAWRQARPAMLGELRPDLSSKLVQWVCGLLEFDPAKRPASAVEAGTALAALNPPPPPVPPESIRPRAAARPAAAGGSGIVRPPAAAAVPAAVVQTAPAPAVSASRPASTTSVKPVKRPSAGLTVAIGVLATAALAAGGWFAFSKWDASNSMAEQVAAAAARPARTPAPSVGEAIWPPKPVNPPSKPVASAQPAPVAKVEKPPKVQPPRKPAPNAAQAVSAPPGPLAVSESFEYPEGKPIEGMGGGIAWAGPWRGPAAMIDGKSMAFDSLPSKGGSLIIPPAQSEILLSRPLGPLSAFVDPAKGGVWHFAFLLQHSSDVPTPGGDIQLNPYNIADVHDLVKIVATDGGGVLHLTLNNEKNPLEVKDPSKPVFVVLRTTLGNPKLGNWDVRAELFVNPKIDAKWPSEDAQKVEVKLPYRMLPKQLGLLIRKPPRTDAITRIDEVRFSHQATGLLAR
jgi:hypothetical protein